MKCIEVIISPQGQTTLQTRGYSGNTCQEASRWLERAMGEVIADQRTSEFHQHTPQPEQIRQQR